IGYFYQKVFLGKDMDNTLLQAIEEQIENKMAEMKDTLRFLKGKMEIIIEQEEKLQEMKDNLERMIEVLEEVDAY
ncbi:MAG: hypothetical protein EBR27_13555, partial [Betaproteobacteria bacterium]|nr:hypothetical protein [Betaproteobacteria bacterium]